MSLQALERLLSEEGITSDDSPLEVRRADGMIASLRKLYPREPATRTWIPLLFCWEDDGVRTHLGVGPWDLFGHYSSAWEYAPETDSYSKRTRWAILPLLSGGAERSRLGSKERAGFQLFDPTRLEYFLAWWRAEDEARLRRGQRLAPASGQDSTP